MMMMMLCLMGPSPCGINVSIRICPALSCSAWMLPATRQQLMGACKQTDARLQLRFNQEGCSLFTADWKKTRVRLHGEFSCRPIASLLQLIVIHFCRVEITDSPAPFSSSTIAPIAPLSPSSLSFSPHLSASLLAVAWCLSRRCLCL